MQLITIHSDGGSRGNPGLAAVGYEIKFDNLSAVLHKQVIGINTNNVAEHLAVQIALEYLLTHKITAAKLEIYLDSELVVKQLRGEYKIKNPNLKLIATKTLSIISLLKISGIGEIQFIHIKRELNKLADKLVNEALDEEKA